MHDLVALVADPAVVLEAGGAIHGRTLYGCEAETDRARKCKKGSAEALPFSMLNETQVDVMRRAGPVPDCRPEGWLTWIRQVVQRAASAASHLRSPVRTSVQLDHLLSSVRP